jgi:hypothetical protein
LALTGRKKQEARENRNFYSSPNIVRLNRSWRVTWEKHVARMERKNAWFSLEELTGRDCLEDVDIDGKLVTKWILRKRVKRVRILVHSSGYCKHGKETSGFLRNHQILKNACAQQTYFCSLQIYFCKKLC